MIREMNLNDYEDVRILVKQIHELHLSNRPDIYNDGESFPKEYFEKVLSDGIYGLEILTVDSHIKRGEFIPSHLHLDCCYLLEADENEPLRIKEDENSGVKWIDIDKVTEITNEPKMVPIYQKLNDKLDIWRKQN